MKKNRKDFYLFYTVQETSLKVKFEFIYENEPGNFTCLEEWSLSELEKVAWHPLPLRYLLRQKRRVPGRYVTLFKSRIFVFILRRLCSTARLTSL